MVMSGMEMMLKALLGPEGVRQINELIHSGAIIEILEFAKNAQDMKLRMFEMQVAIAQLTIEVRKLRDMHDDGKAQPNADRKLELVANNIDARQG